MLPLMLLFMISPQTVLCSQWELVPNSERPYKQFAARFTNSIDNRNDLETQLNNEHEYHTNHIKEVLFAPVPMKNQNIGIDRSELDSKISDVVKRYHLEPKESTINEHNTNNVKLIDILTKKEPQSGPGHNITAMPTLVGKHEFEPIYRKKGESVFRRLYNNDMVETTTLDMVTRTEGSELTPTESFITQYRKSVTRKLPRNEKLLFSSDLRFPGVVVDSRRMYSINTLDPRTGQDKVKVIDTFYHPMSHKLYLNQYRFNGFKLSKMGTMKYDTYRLNGLPPDQPEYKSNNKEVQQNKPQKSWSNKQPIYSYVFPSKPRIFLGTAAPMKFGYFNRK